MMGSTACSKHRLAHTTKKSAPLTADSNSQLRFVYLQHSAAAVAHKQAS